MCSSRYSATARRYVTVRERSIPRLIFLLGEDTAGTRELLVDDTHGDRQAAFRARLADRGVTIATLTTPAELETQLLHALSVLARPRSAASPGNPDPDDRDGVPVPPRLYAEPRYIGSHTFVGRQAQLDSLDDWAAPSHPHPMLLFEAIGGSGKSMLTWDSFFTTSWTSPSAELTKRGASHLANSAGVALRGLGQLDWTLATLGLGMEFDLDEQDWANARIQLSNIADVLADQNRLARAERCYSHA